MAVNLRQARVDDADSLAYLIANTWPDDTSDPARIARVIRETDRCTLIAEGERPLGFIDAFSTVSADGIHRWEIDLLAVLPEARGQGSAGELVGMAMEEGKWRGAAMTRGLVRLDNAASERVFARAGFTAGAPQRLWVMTVEVMTGRGAVKAGPVPTKRYVDRDTYMLPVVTLIYSGVWLEGGDGWQDLGDDTSVHLVAEHVGGLIVSADTDRNEGAKAGGYTEIGGFRWWERTLN